MYVPPSAIAGSSRAGDLGPILSVGLLHGPTAGESITLLSSDPLSAESPSLLRWHGREGQRITLRASVGSGNTRHVYSLNVGSFRNSLGASGRAQRLLVGAGHTFETRVDKVGDLYVAYIGSFASDAEALDAASKLGIGPPDFSLERHERS